MAPGIFGARRMQATPPCLEKSQRFRIIEPPRPRRKRMKHLLWLAMAALVSSIPAQSQEQKPATAEPAGNAKSCLIVKHKGTVGRRLLWTALIGVPIAPGAKYDFVDGVNVKGGKMSYKGKELEAMQAAGARVIVLDNKHTPEDVESARNACRGDLPAPSQAVATAPPADRPQPNPPPVAAP